jgi:hypothetical protein
LRSAAPFYVNIDIGGPYMELNQELIDEMIQKHLGEKDNPLTGKTFAEIQEMAEEELADESNS